MHARLVQLCSGIHILCIVQSRFVRSRDRSHQLLCAVRRRLLRHEFGLDCLHCMRWWHVRDVAWHDLRHTVPSVRRRNLLDKRHGAVRELLGRHVRHCNGSAIFCRLPRLRHRHLRSNPRRVRLLGVQQRNLCERPWPVVVHRLHRMQPGHVHECVLHPVRRRHLRRVHGESQLCVILQRDRLFAVQHLRRGSVHRRLLHRVLRRNMRNVPCRQLLPVGGGCRALRVTRFFSLLNLCLYLTHTCTLLPRCAHGFCCLCTPPPR